MFQWAKDWVMDKVSGAASTAIQAGGTMAGNTVGGVGSMIENSGRGVGETANGYVGGVGSYINSYGDGIINSTAASKGSSSAEKKTAVKPTQAVSKASGGAQRPAAAKNLPAAASKALPASKQTSALAGKTPPAKPPPAKAPPAKKPTSAQQSAKPNTLPKISASAADKTSDGKTRISAASRPSRPSGGGAHTASSGVKKTTQNNSGPRPLTKIAAGKEDRTADGKIKISAASRPRPVKAA